MIYELIPQNGRKSFYGKARVCEKNGNKYLIYYNSLVMSLDKNNNLHRHYREPSATTATHIKSFVKQELGIDFNKAKYLKLPYEKREREWFLDENICN